MEVERAAFVFLSVIGIWALIIGIALTLATGGEETSSSSIKALPEPKIEEEWKLWHTSSSSGQNTAGSLD